MASFLGKLVVINGAASGIGRATAKLLHSRGALLSLSDINKTALQTLKRELEESAAARKRTGNGDNDEAVPALKNGDVANTIFTAAFDVRVQDACHTWISDTVAHFGRPIAGAANLAGVTNMPQKGPSLGRDVNETELDFVWGINVKGTVNCLRAELPHMQEGSAAGGGGSAIVNAASLSSFMGLPGYMPYSSSKHAVVGITRTVAKEEGARAIRVNAIAPAMIDTPMLQQVAESRGTSLSVDMFGAGPSPALGRLGTSMEVAEVVVFLLSPQSSFINGASIIIDGGMSC